MNTEMQEDHNIYVNNRGDWHKINKEGRASLFKFYSKYSVQNKQNKKYIKQNFKQCFFCPRHNNFSTSEDNKKLPEHNTWLQEIYAGWPPDENEWN